MRCKTIARTLVCSAILVAFQASATSLLDAYDSAFTNDRAWRLAQARHQESRELEVQAQAQLLPSMSFSAGNNQVTQQLTTGTNTSPQQNFLQTSRVLSVRQPLLRTRQVYALRQAQSQVGQADKMLEDESQQLVVRIVGAYFDAMLARDREALLDAQFKVVEMRMRMTRASLIAGQSTRTDIDQAQAELDKIAADQIQARLANSFASKKLELLTGMPQQSISKLNLEKFKPERFVLLPLEVLLGKAVSNSPSLQAKRADIEIAQAMLKQAETGHQPTLDLTAQASETRGESSFYTATRNKGHAVGLQFTMPLFSGGAVPSQVRQALARYNQAHEQYEASLNDLTAQIYNESNSVAEGVLRIKALETALVSADQLVFSIQKGVQAGTRSQFDVVQAIGNRYQAEFDLMRARYEFVMASLRTRAFLGELDRAAVEAVQSVMQ